MHNARKLFVLFSFALATSGALAQTSNGSDDAKADSVQELSFSGSVDTYYHRSFMTEEDAPKTAFANLPGFSLGMINFVTTYSTSKTGVVADLVFGPRGTDAIFNAPMYKNASGGSSSQIINQMFIYYQVNKDLKLSLGQFNTFLGYESISPVKNIHYSTSYLFTFGPFNHTGVLADFDLHKHMFAKLSLMNPTDYLEYNPFNSITIGAQLGFKGEKASSTLSTTYGDPDGELNGQDSIGTVSAGNALQLDYTASFNITKKYQLGISSSFRSVFSGEVKVSGSDHETLKKSGYYGVALYQTLMVSPTYTFALRTELFNEFHEGVGAIGVYDPKGVAHVFAATLSANMTVSHFRFIPEMRIDKASTGAFTLASNGLPTTKMVSLYMAVVYEIPAIRFKVKSIHP